MSWRPGDAGYRRGGARGRTANTNDGHSFAPIWSPAGDQIAFLHVNGLTEARARHASADFLAFLRRVERVYPDGELHVILDNVSTHKTPAVRAWLERHPRISFHFTPTSASWMNQVETWFSVLTRQVNLFDDRAAGYFGSPTGALGPITAPGEGPTPRAPG
jgi:hypothetical protein